MASRFLPVIVKNALQENQDLLPEFLKEKPGMKRVLAFCRNFRRAAIGSLLLTGRSQHFLFYLPQSGRAFAHFLAQVSDAAPRLSQCAPFFDAVGVGDFAGAEEIARRSRRSWARGEEYEEDFLFVEFLMQRFMLGASAEACEELLGRYARALQGAEDIRLEICKALLQQDADAFNAALEQYLSDRKDFLEKKAETTVIHEEERATEWHLCVEGLALVRLADRMGLETEEEYLFIPSVAREVGKGPVEAEAWRHIDLESAPAPSRPKKKR